MEVIKLNDDISVAGQPSFQDLRRLREVGYRTLVNCRLPAEQPEDEAENARRVGLDYIHIPIAQNGWREEHFDRFAELLRERDRDRTKFPILVHCGRGARSGILVITALAAEKGWTYQQLDQMARALGLDLPEAAIAYLRRRTEERMESQPGSW